MNKVRLARARDCTPSVKCEIIDIAETTFTTAQDGSPISYSLPPSRSGRGLSNLSCNRGGGILLHRKQSLEDRFWSHVNKDGPLPDESPELGSCWLWVGSINRAGYGAFNVTRASDAERLGDAPTRRPLGAHRVAKLLESPRPWPAGWSLQIDHLCRVKNCVRPSHLEWVTPIVNMNRVPGFSTGYCRRWHPLSGDNLSIRADGSRRCKQCLADHARRYYHEKRTARSRAASARKEALMSVVPAAADAIGTI